MSDYPAIKCENCRFERKGAHYNIWNISKGGVERLRRMFPEGEANSMNFALFSTSGVHGCYTTIEEIEQSLMKYGDNPAFMNEESEEASPDDYVGNGLTVTVYHPRIIGVGYGVINIKLEDVSFFKALRESSWRVVQQIGK